MEVEHLGHELVPIWNGSFAAGYLTHCATVVAPKGRFFLKNWLTCLLTDNEDPITIDRWDVDDPWKAVVVQFNCYIGICLW